MNKVSFIVPFFNGEKTLERAITSLLAQTHTDLEIIAVDDGSTDRSCEIIENYSKADSRIRLLRVPHKGVSAARNAGTAVATGDFVQYIDADDYVEPDMLSVMLGAMKRANADIAVCSYSHPSIKNYLGDRVLDLSRRADLMLYYQNTFALQVPWNKLYRRRVITEPFDEEVSFCEDGLFGLANMKNARFVVSTSRELYHYYVAPSNVPASESSCINKIAKANNFWETHETYWYKQTALLEKTRKILFSKYSHRDAEDMQYIRVFDFLIWEVLILGDMGISRYGLIREVQAVIREQEFRNSINAKAKYGIRMRDLPDSELDCRAAEFVDATLTAISEIKANDMSLRPFDVAMSLFAGLFIEENDIMLNNSDFLAAAFLNFEYRLTDEADYALSLLVDDSGDAQSVFYDDDTGEFAPAY